MSGERREGPGGAFTIDQVVNEEGRAVPFNPDRVADTIERALERSGQPDLELARELAGVAERVLAERSADGPPTTSELQDIVEQALRETGYEDAAVAHAEERAWRERLRRVVQVVPRPGTEAGAQPWAKRVVARDLVERFGLAESVSDVIAASVERKVFGLGSRRVSRILVRQILLEELAERGYVAEAGWEAGPLLRRSDVLTRLQGCAIAGGAVPLVDFEPLEREVTRRWLPDFTLDEVFSPSVAQAHRDRRIAVDTLERPTGVYALSLAYPGLRRGTKGSSRPFLKRLNEQVRDLSRVARRAVAIPQFNLLLANQMAREMAELNARDLQRVARNVLEALTTAWPRPDECELILNLHLSPPPGRPLPEELWKGGEAAPEALRFALALLRAAGQLSGSGSRPSFRVHTGSGRAPGKSIRSLVERTLAEASRTPGTQLVFPGEGEIAPGLRGESAGWGQWLGLVTQNVALNLPRCARRAGRHERDRFFAEVESVLELAIVAHRDKVRFLSALAPAADEAEITAAFRAARYRVCPVGLVEGLEFVSGRTPSDEELTEALEKIRRRLERASGKNWMRFVVERSLDSRAAEVFWEADRRLVGEGPRVAGRYSLGLEPGERGVTDDEAASQAAASDVG
ncbi:MAG: ATP cone domain-containing protein [Planctomycetota bacterium]